MSCKIALNALVLLLIYLRYDNFNRMNRPLFFLLSLLVFKSCKPSYEEFWLVDPDEATEAGALGMITVDYFYTGSQSIMLASKHPYGLTTTVQGVEGGDQILVELFAKTKNQQFNLTAHSEWGEFYSNAYIEDTQEEWRPVNLFFQVPDSVSVASVKIYFHYYGKDTAYVDNMSITKNPSPSLSHPLPDFVAIPLANALLRELNVYNIFCDKRNFSDYFQDERLGKVFDYYGVSQAVFYKSYLTDPALLERLEKYNEQKATLTVGLKKEPLYQGLAGYSTKIVHHIGDTVSLKVSQHHDEAYSVSLFSLVPNYKEKTIKRFGKHSGDYFQFETKDLSSGSYGIQLKNKENTFKIPLILNSKKQADLVILAPVTTWHTYNDFDGKSFYRNYVDSNAVYFVSTNRPLNSLHFDSTFLGHDFFIFDHIFDYFKEKYEVNVYPDYYLQKHPELFQTTKTLVFAQHCEYFSPEMFQALETFSATKNIIALGGNQAYNKITWHDDYTRIECRKDGTLHENTIMPGGVWRSSFTSEARIWGVAYTDSGYATYEPYTLENTKHWLLKGLENLQPQEVFGRKGIDDRGISGDEMDKRDASSPSNTILIAKGENPQNGGGELVIIEKDSVATLSTGSIASGAGLKVDKVFTKMIDNFLDNYHPAPKK